MKPKRITWWTPIILEFAEKKVRNFNVNLNIGKHSYLHRVDLHSEQTAINWIFKVLCGFSLFLHKIIAFSTYNLKRILLFKIGALNMFFEISICILLTENSIVCVILKYFTQRSTNQDIDTQFFFHYTRDFLNNFPLCFESNLWSICRFKAKVISLKLIYVWFGSKLAVCSIDRQTCDT